MLAIFSFYLGIVVQIFNNVLNRFEVAEGIGFGTFLLACSLFVVFINLLKFQYGSNGFQEIKSYRKSLERDKQNKIRNSKIERSFRTHR